MLTCAAARSWGGKKREEGRGERRGGERERKERGERGEGEEKGRGGGREGGGGGGRGGGGEEGEKGGGGGGGREERRRRGAEGGRPRQPARAAHQRARPTQLKRPPLRSPRDARRARAPIPRSAGKTAPIHDAEEDMNSISAVAESNGHAPAALPRPERPGRPSGARSTARPSSAPPATCWSRSAPTSTPRGCARRRAGWPTPTRSC